MEATIAHYRQGRHHQHPNQMVLKVGSSATEAEKMVGKTASWTSPSGKVIKGKITQLHGRTGSVRVLFSEKGLPGQSLGKKAKIE
jgi:large subunit ribosomal protein L35Ae